MFWRSFTTLVITSAALSSVGSAPQFFTTSAPFAKPPTGQSVPNASLEAELSRARSGRRGSPPRPEPTDCQKLKCVAITYDDGPLPGTMRLLKILRDRGAVATFYVVGINAREFPDIIAAIARDGHELGNHSYRHNNLAVFSDGAVKASVGATDEAVRAVIGTKPATMRPPYGSRNPRVDAAIDKPIILWDVDTMDWQHKNSARVIQVVKQQTRPGSIVLMHDIHESTINASAAVVDFLQSSGYTLVTVSDLLAADGPKARKNYLNLPQALGKVDTPKDLPTLGPPAPAPTTNAPTTGP